MSWQDEALKKKKIDNERYFKEMQKINVIEGKIKEFWNKLLQANNKLDPLIRLSVSNDYIDRFRLSSCGKDIYTYQESVIIGRIFKSRYDYTFKISYDIEKIKLYGVKHVQHYKDVDGSIFKGEGDYYYKIDDSIIDILLKNLCTGLPVTDGLTIE